VPAPPNLDTQAFNTIPVIEYGPFCPRRPHPQPVINCDDGRSRACALSLARRFDMSRCSNCFGWMSSLQPPQSRIVLTLLSIYYMSVISNDLIAQLEPSKLRLVLLPILIAANYLFFVRRVQCPLIHLPQSWLRSTSGIRSRPQTNKICPKYFRTWSWWLSSNCVEHTNHSSLLAGWTSCPLDQACISNG
jgi:hypothetical protein